MESQSDDVGVIYSDAIQIDEHGHVLPGLFIASHWNLPEMPQGRILTSLLDGNFVVPMTTLIRKSCFDNVGVYDENLPWEDWDMWMRIARHYSFLYSPIPFAKYRLHDKSYTASDPARIARESCRVCLKQFTLGDLSVDQKSRLTSRLLSMSEDLYKNKDPDAGDILFALWRATGHRRAVWMYRFSRWGISFENWQKATSWRVSLFRRCGVIGGSASRPVMTSAVTSPERASVPREAGLPRLSGLHVDPSHAWFLHYRSLFADLQKTARYARGRMLDIGCGNKPFEETFRRSVSGPFGCDVVQSSQSRADVICPATNLPFKDQSYGTVLITQVIEHVADHQAIFPGSLSRARITTEY